MEYVNLFPIEPIVHHKFKVLSVHKNELALCELDLQDATIEILNNISFCEIADFTYKDRVFSPNKRMMYLFEFEINRRAIKFYHLNIDTFTLNKIVTLDLAKYFSLETQSHLDYYTDLVYLDEKNVLFFVSALPNKYGTPYFKYCFLINAVNGTIEEVSPNLLNGDSLLRFDIAFNFYLKNESFVLLKTGRIMAYEKKEMFDTTDRNNPYYDHLESLYLVSARKLIEEKNMVNVFPLEVITYNHSMDNFKIDDESISYILEDFEENTETLIHFKLDVHKKEEIRNSIEIKNFIEKENVDPWYYPFVLESMKNKNHPRFILNEQEFHLTLHLKLI